MIERIERNAGTHINSPSEGGNRTSYHRILIDGDDFRVLEDGQRLLSSVGQLNKSSKREPLREIWHPNVERYDEQHTLVLCACV